MICRICEKEIKDPVFSLGNHPVSNDFLSEEDLKKPEITYPLDVYVCPSCFLMQISEFKKAKDIFNEDYVYLSSYSETWLKHCENYVDMIVKELNLTKDSFVVEIGSNDGSLLQYFKKYNIRTIGVDPAKKVAEIADQKDIPTFVDYFDESFCKRNGIRSKADLIICNNVLAHNPNLLSFVKGLKNLLKPEGVITIEFPHLLSLIKNVEFDTIYQEHYSYFSYKPLETLLKTVGMVIFKVEELDIHGGSLRVYAGFKNKFPSIYGNFFKSRTLQIKEDQFGLYNLSMYKSFYEKVKEMKISLLHYLARVKDEGEHIVGYGAPAKGNTLLNYCGIDRDIIDYVVDKNPYKQGKFLPGSHIPVKDPREIEKTKPDGILILPWNIEEEIREQLSYTTEWGCDLFTPWTDFQGGVI